jgi:hypothetical protein
MAAVVGGRVSSTVDGVTGRPVVATITGSSVVEVAGVVCGGVADETTGRFAAAMIDVSPKMPEAVRPVAMMRAPAATCGCFPRVGSGFRRGWVAMVGVTAAAGVARAELVAEMGAPDGGAQLVDDVGCDLCVGMSSGA